MGQSIVKRRYCDPDLAEFNNGRCHDGERCIWEVEDSDISVGVCRNGNDIIQYLQPNIQG